MGDSDLEQHRRFLVCDGRLSNQLVGERVVPRKVDSDFGESELQQFQLSKVFVQKISG